MGAAHRVMQLGEGKKNCLVLENHPIFGGEAKRNTFLVGATWLHAPQGSNTFGIPDAGDSTLVHELWNDLGMPREVTYSKLPDSRKPLEAAFGNYQFQLWSDTFESHGFYFPEERRWVTNPWGHSLAGVPWSEDVKRDMRNPKPQQRKERPLALVLGLARGGNFAHNHLVRCSQTTDR